LGAAEQTVGVDVDALGLPEDDEIPQTGWMDWTTHWTAELKEAVPISFAEASQGLQYRTPLVTDRAFDDTLL
jgi:hypothetical protein